MKHFVIFLALNIVTIHCLSCGADETEFKNLCLKKACMDLYNSALKTTESSDGLEKIAQQFEVETTYTSDQTIKVTVQFKDSKDAGLLVLNNPLSCIEISLFQRTDFTYSKEKKIFNMLTTKYQDDSGTRQISFEIVDNSEFLQDRSKNGETTYYGYFNLKFTMSTEVVLTLRISSQLTVDTLTQIQTKSDSTLQLVKNDSNCNAENTCITLVPSTLKYCTDQACTTYTDSLKLVVNQMVYVKQILDSSAFPSAFLEQPTLFIRGIQMIREIPVKSVTQLKTEGAILIEFTLDFVYTEISLLVDSHVLINSQQLLSTQHLEPAHSVVQTSTLGCIYSDKTTTVCPSCAEQEKYSRMTPECIVKKMSCASDETIVNGICMKESCTNNYQERVKTISVSSSIELDDKKDLKVTYSFDDIELDGLLQRDNINSCIINKLFRYKSLLYSQETEDKREIQSTFNKQTNKREMVFYIQSNEFSTVLIADNDNGKITYTGYYSHQFYVGQQVLLIYNFHFVIQIGSGTSASTVTSTNPRVIYGKATCNSVNKCIQTATSDLKFCTTSDCSETTLTKDFILNEDIYLKQTITHDGFEDWSLRLIGSEFTSEGLQRTVAGVQVSNGKGYIIIKLEASFAYPKKLKIIVNSELISPSRRMLVNRILTQSNAQSNQESSHFCIKETAQSSCEGASEKPDSPPVSRGNILFMVQIMILMLLW